MEQQQIKALIDAMAASDLAEMEFSRDGWTLRLRRAPLGAGSAVPPRPAWTTDGAGAAQTGIAEADADAPLARQSVPEVAAPLHGIVHLQPSPGEPAFVTVGQAVSAGQTLCVIEAMKVFNEVCAEQGGVVAAVLVASGQEVEAGQPLLRFAGTPR